MAFGSPMALSVSLSDWGSPAEQQKCNTKWEVWGESSRDHHRVNNPMVNSRAHTSLPEESSDQEYNDRWDKWNPEEPENHPARVQNLNLLRSSRTCSPSENSSQKSSESKYNDIWDGWEPEKPENHPERGKNHKPNPKTPGLIIFHKIGALNHQAGKITITGGLGQ